MKAFAHDNSGAWIARKMGGIAGLAAAGLLLGGCGVLQHAESGARVQAFCYSTLALVDCYPAPLPSQDYRLVGVGTAHVPTVPR